MSAYRWMQSYSGRVILPRELKPSMVSFEDIPHALAQKVRFAGQLDVPGYTVAQHCVLGARQIDDPRVALAFLLHEVSEVYLPDIPSPLKPFVVVQRPESDPAHLAGLDSALSWSQLEDQHADAIFEALDLTSIRALLDSPEVKETDLRMLMTEKRDLMGPSPQPWGIDVKPFEFDIASVWTYAVARGEFEREYVSYRRKAGL